MKSNIIDLFKGGTLLIQSDAPINLIELSIDHKEKKLGYILEDNIAILSLKNYLYLGDDPFSVNAYVALINEIRNTPEIKGVVFEIFSDGGVDVASELLRSELSLLSQTKPVVAFCHYAASGAYLAALGCNIIIASNGLSRFGSIGSYITLNKWYREVYSLIKQDVYAAQSTKKNENWRKYVSDNEIELYQNEANKIANYFISQVKKSRDNVSEDALKGAMYLASEAKSLGLIDGIGNLQYAFNRINSLIKNYS